VIAAATGLARQNQRGLAAQLAEAIRADPAAGNNFQKSTLRVRQQRRMAIGVAGRNATGASQQHQAAAASFAERLPHRAGSFGTPAARPPPPQRAAAEGSRTPLLSQIWPGPARAGRHQLITLIKQPHPGRGRTPSWATPQTGEAAKTGRAQAVTTGAAALRRRPPHRRRGSQGGCGPPPFRSELCAACSPLPGPAKPLHQLLGQHPLGPAGSGAR